MVAATVTVVVHLALHVPNFCCCCYDWYLKLSLCVYQLRNVRDCIPGRALLIHVFNFEWSFILVVFVLHCIALHLQHCTSKFAETVENYGAFGPDISAIKPKWWPNKSIIHTYVEQKKLLQSYMLWSLLIVNVSTPLFSPFMSPSKHFVNTHWIHIHDIFSALPMSEWQTNWMALYLSVIFCSSEWTGWRACGKKVRMGSKDNTM